MASLTYHPMPCPNCGSTNIGVKDDIVSTPWRIEARKVWAYCRYCAYKGPEIICDLSVKDEDEIADAYKAWNKE